MAGQPEAALESNRAGCMVRRTCEFIALRRQGLQPLASSFVAKTLGDASGFAGGFGGAWPQSLAVRVRGRKRSGYSSEKAFPEKVCRAKRGGSWMIPSEKSLFLDGAGLH